MEKLEITCSKCGKLSEQTIVTYKKQKKKYNSHYCRGCSIKISNLNKYGVENTFSLPEVRQRTNEKNLREHGCLWNTQRSQMIEKSKRTCLQKYGVENASKSSEIKKKYEDLMMKKYGVTNAYKSETVKEKIKETCLAKYGVDNVAKSFEIRGKSWNKHCYEYDNIKFDSSWELFYWIWCKENDVSIERNTIGYDYLDGHKFFIDFIVDGRLVEVKNTYLLSKFEEKEIIKLLNQLNGILIHKHEILKIKKALEDKYGKDFYKIYSTAR
jgi:hypothetical protein